MPWTNSKMAGRTIRHWDNCSSLLKKTSDGSWREYQLIADWGMRGKEGASAAEHCMKDWQPLLCRRSSLEVDEGDISC